MADLVSFDAEKAKRYLEAGLLGFLGDPPDSDYQRGFLAAMLVTYREGLGKGLMDARMNLLDAMCEGG